MRVLVCGGRDFNDYELLERTLNGYDITEIIHGGARGADTLSGHYGGRRNVPIRVWPANWEVHGRSAGVIRNKQMLTEGNPDCVIAFPGGRGTKNMIDQASKKGIPVSVIQIQHT